MYTLSVAMVVVVKQVHHSRTVSTSGIVFCMCFCEFVRMSHYIRDVLNADVHYKAYLAPLVGRTGFSNN